MISSKPNEFQLTSFVPTPRRNLWIDAGFEKKSNCVKFYFSFGGERLASVKGLGLSGQYELTESQRRNDLWKTTCFEIFLTPMSTTSGPYQEVNLAPDGSWNIYEFAEERKGMQNSHNLLGFPLAAVSISFSKNYCCLDISLVQAGPRSVTEVQVGMTAVVESSDQTTYWAMSHKKNKPDFHDHASWLGKLHV